MWEYKNCRVRNYPIMPILRRDMADIEEWVEEDSLKYLIKRKKNWMGLFVDHDNKVIGFTIYKLYPKKLHIIEIAVDLKHRRKGAGTNMIKKLICKTSPHRRTSIDLEVRESNLIAQLFFRSLGFKAYSISKNYYEDTNKDAYLMAYSPYENSQYEKLNFSYFHYTYNINHKLTPYNRISQYFEKEKSKNNF